MDLFQHIHRVALHLLKTSNNYKIYLTFTYLQCKERMIYMFSKIQLVVYHQCCVLIGLATTTLYAAICYSPLVAKSAGFENQNNGG